MSSETKVKKPDQKYIDQRTDGDRVPHDGRDTLGDAEKADPSLLEELIELAQRRIMYGLLCLDLGLERCKPRVERRGSVDFPRIDSLLLQWPGVLDS